ncbi:hypothetical protein A3K86_10745 [Photobacterium jeanii]|uniref:Uncharacterized protein n=1 Tax=Photobacterium jeanii TaxID=858640 RepID=A0A178KIB2_9GAMM|nr:DUF6338 family protein [Photobacterium jeanii]OAN16493.1 hypothetical protein A3K86_10745 [Photobacterium jeanii]PST85919.1 hypothetical protein C9I91_22355 [Photobacterium jeanii]
MNISDFALKLLILFLPGIICSFIVDTFTNHKERAKFEFIINSYVYGLLSYGFYWLLISKLGGLVAIEETHVIFLASLFDQSKVVSFKEIFNVCIVATLLGALITYVHTHKLHFRLLRFLRVTKKFGELDVWGYFMNSPDVNWITVRDIENNLMYDGWVQAFSDNSKEAEILLGDVVVYKNDTGEELYEVSSQYLSLDRAKIIIEMRK